MWLWRLKIRPTTQSYQKVGATCGRPFGILLNGVTLDKIREGYSKVRNRAIASAFTYMKFIEEWGSGIPRIINEFNLYELQEPELLDFDGDFRVNFYRRQNTITNQSNHSTNQSNQSNQSELKNIELTERDNIIISILKENSQIKQTEIANMIDWNLSSENIILKNYEI